MTLSPRHLLLRPRGRISRGEFAAGVVFLLATMLVLERVMGWLDPSTGAGFWFGLLLVVAFPFMLYSVYGQRLHDLGRTVWALTGTLFLLLFATLVVMAINGGDDLIYEVANFTPEQAEDPEIVGPIVEGYQQRIQERSARPLAVIGAVLWGGLTLWLLAAKGDADTNRYGPPPE